MSTKFELASNAAASSWEDITDLVNWERFQLGGSAHRGEIFSANGFDLLDNAGLRVLPYRRAFRVTETATTPDTVLFRGRTVGSTKARGVIVTEPSKAFDVNLADHNADFGGQGFAGSARPAETDVQRIQYLLDTYLQGQNRASTDLLDTYFSSSNPINLPAHTYEGVQAIDWFNHIVESTGKQFFITVDSELFYDAVTSTAYAADLSITDVLPAAADEYYPIDPRAFEDGSELVTGVRFRFLNGQIVTVVRSAVETANDKWRVAIVDESAHSTAAATTRANKYLDEFDHAQITYSCSIDLDETEVDKIKYGQTVSFRSAACGVLTPETLRVGSLQWTKISADRYQANLELGYPSKFGKRAAPSTPPVTGPVPFVPATPGSPGLVQWKEVELGTSLPGDIVMDDPVTPGHLLVCYVWSRSAAPGMPDDFTEDEAQQLGGEASYIAAGHKFADVVTDTFPVSSVVSGATRHYLLMEWDSIGAPDNFLTGTLPDTSPANIDPGSGLPLGIYAVHTDIAGREVHVISPSTIVYENWTQVSLGFGPYGSVGYGATGAGLDIQATSGAVSFHQHEYIVGNYPLLSSGQLPPVQGQLVVEPMFVWAGTEPPTDFPYAPSSLVVTSNGIDVSDAVDETDPAAGTWAFTAGNEPFTGAEIVVKYQSAG